MSSTAATSEALVDPLGRTRAPLSLVSELDAVTNCLDSRGVNSLIPPMGTSVPDFSGTASKTVKACDQLTWGGAGLETLYADAPIIGERDLLDFEGTLRPEIARELGGGRQL